MTTNRPDPLRCTATVLLSLTCAALLIEIDSATPWPATDPTAFLDWWEGLGTATAAITLLRILGIALAGWGIFIGTAGLLASMQPSALLQGVWCRITPGSFRQILAAGAITITLAAPVAAAAGTQSVDAQIVLEDLGMIEDPSQQVEAGRFTPVLTDIGPAAVQMSTAPEPATMILPNSDTTASRLTEATSAAPTGTEPPGAPDSRLWTVSEGDHLWKIAMKTLRDHGHSTEPDAVVGYWKQLIDLNSEALNGNPDLIHPGMVLTLPPVPPRS